MHTVERAARRFAPNRVSIGEKGTLKNTIESEGSTVRSGRAQRHEDGIEEIPKRSGERLGDQPQSLLADQALRQSQLGIADDRRPDGVETFQTPAPSTSSSPGSLTPKTLSHNPWAPLAIPAYRSFWLAGLFSHMGTWMHETGAQWMMASMEPSPEMVSAVRTAMSAPIFFLALPAGVWADRFDRRRYLLATQLLLLSIAAVMAVLTGLELMTPGLLLGLTLTMGIAMVLNMPAWQALTPELVPPTLVPTAVQAGSVSFNLARALGPAMAGLVIAQFGIAATFLLNAFSFLGMIGVLLYWRSPSDSGDCRATPYFFSELRKGVTVVAQSTHIRHVLIRVLVFGFTASILWSLLPLVAKQRLGFDERGFGMCLGMIGMGAISGAWVLPWLRARFSSESILLGTQAIYASICLLIGVSREVLLIVPALVLIGVCWMGTMTTLNATAQVHLPRAFRARGMASYLMAFSLGMASGAATWGWVAYAGGIQFAFVTASAAVLGGAFALHHLPIGSLTAE